MNIVFFTGAGVSAESGIPTFRDYKGEANEKGFEELLTLTSFMSNPGRTWNWLNGFIDSAKDAKYNKAHELIASIKDAVVITQNIDTFHSDAGSKDVIHLHGSIGKCKCLKCLKVQPLVDKCECGSYTKPDFTFYEEDLDNKSFARAELVAKQADIFIIVGTSGQVYPAASIPKKAKLRGAKVYEINPGTSGYSARMIDKYIKKSASEGIQELIDELKILSV